MVCGYKISLTKPSKLQSLFEEALKHPDISLSLIPDNTNNTILEMFQLFHVPPVPGCIRSLSCVLYSSLKLTPTNWIWLPNICLYFDLNLLLGISGSPRTPLYVLLWQHRIKVARYKPHTSVFHCCAEEPFEKFKKFSFLYISNWIGRQLGRTIIMISCSVTDCGQMDLLPGEEEYSQSVRSVARISKCFVLVLFP